MSRHITGVRYAASVDKSDDRLGPGRPYIETTLLWHYSLAFMVAVINTLLRRLLSVLVSDGGRLYLIMSI